MISIVFSRLRFYHESYHYAVFIFSEDRDVGILYISTKFELEQCINNGQLLSDRKKKTLNMIQHTRTHILKQILFPYRIQVRVIIYQDIGKAISTLYLSIILTSPPSSIVRLSLKSPSDLANDSRYKRSPIHVHQQHRNC